MKNKLVKKITLTAIFSTLSFLFYVIKFPLPFLFPDFLDFQISNLPVVIAGFALNPLFGSLVVVIRFVLKIAFMPSLGLVGDFTDLIIGLAVVLSTSFIYMLNKNKKGGIIALIVLPFVWMLTAILTNYFISAPFYISVAGEEAFIGMCKIIPGINETNYLSKYILYAVIPFNLLLSIIVSTITFFVYKRISNLINNL